MFFNAVVCKNGRILTHHTPQDHARLLKINGMSDVLNDKICRVELVPHGCKYELDKYELKIYDQKIPSWFINNQEEIENKIRQLIKNAIKDCNSYYSNDELVILRKQSNCTSFRSTVFAYDNSYVESVEPSYIIANDFANVMCENGDNVWLYDETCGDFHGNTYVRTFNKSRATCFHVAQANAQDDSQLVLRDTSIGSARGHSYVYMYDRSLCYLHQRATTKLCKDNRAVCIIDEFIPDEFVLKKNTFQHEKLTITAQNHNNHHLHVVITGEGTVSVVKILDLVNEFLVK